VGDNLSGARVGKESFHEPGLTFWRWSQLYDKRYLRHSTAASTANPTSSAFLDFDISSFARTTTASVSLKALYLRNIKKGLERLELLLSLSLQSAGQVAWLYLLSLICLPPTTSTPRW
jgi:hypothetical protein